MLTRHCIGAKTILVLPTSFFSARAMELFTDGTGVLQKALEGKLSPANPSPLEPKTLDLVKQRFTDILERDWQDAEQGFYPKALLFENPWQDFFWFYPQVWLDLPGIWGRIKRKQYQEFDRIINTENYPKYYLQNFHHQTDGYLSDRSADLYDLQSGTPVWWQCRYHAPSHRASDCRVLRCSRQFHPHSRYCLWDRTYVADVEGCISKNPTLWNGIYPPPICAKPTNC